MNLAAYDPLPLAAQRHGCSVGLLRKRLAPSGVGIPGAVKFGRAWGIPRTWKYTPGQVGNPTWVKRNGKARR